MTVAGVPGSPANDLGHTRDSPMTTAEAARYCGFKTTAAIRKALLDGRLVPLGRRGGTGHVHVVAASARRVLGRCARWYRPSRTSRCASRRTLEDIMEKDGKWIMRWRYAIAPKPVKPGVWRRKEGGFLVRGRAVDRRTGKLRAIMKTVDGGTRRERTGSCRKRSRRSGIGEVRGEVARIRFGEYAASLFERKVTKGKIRSAKTREKWESVLRLHLLPAFGDHFLDGIRRADIEAWLEAMGKRCGRASIRR